MGGTVVALRPKSIDPEIVRRKAKKVYELWMIEASGKIRWLNMFTSRSKAERLAKNYKGKLEETGNEFSVTEIAVDTELPTNLNRMTIYTTKKSE